MYQQLKKEKSQEIVMLLDLFEGKVTLSEILDTDIPIINQLRDAKLELKRQQAIDTAKASKQQQGVKLTDPSKLTKRGKTHD